jgi:DNA repair protein RadC
MRYSTKSLRVRSDCGSLCKVPETFSTNFVRDAASGLASVPDSEIIEAALNILAKRMSRGSVLASPRAARDYLALRFGQVEQEVFAAVYLTLCGASVYVRAPCWFCRDNLIFPTPTPHY